MPRTLLRQSGFSLIELMIASTIGLILLSGLALLFVNTSESNRELQKTSQQIENGRFAIDILSTNLRLAGFYGHLSSFSSIAAPATVPPDPCETGNVAALLSSAHYYVQAYPGTIHATTPASDAAADVSGTSCGALTAANLQPGSDVLVIRRADTNWLTATDTTTTNAFYIQASSSGAEIQLGSGGVIGNCPNAVEHCKATGNPNNSTLKLTNGAVPAPSAPIRKFLVHVYFVARCSVGSDTVGGVAGVCRATDDGIPTLKRLELTSTGTMTIVPLVEGIEYVKYVFGVDDTPAAVNAATLSKGDASVDSYVAAPGDWTSVVAAKVYVLARNTESTQGYTDNKTYAMGPFSVPARNDSVKRHVYATATHLSNPAGRREIP